MDWNTALILKQNKDLMEAGCGTGDGGFKSGNTCAKGDGSSSPSVKSLRDLSRSEKDALQDYSTDKFQAINGSLRDGSPSGENKRIVEKMDSALERAPKYQQATVRSFTLPAGEEGKRIRSQLTSGGVLEDAAYTSTRKRPTVTDMAAFTTKQTASDQVVLRVEGKSGVDMSSLSLNPGEGEVLFPRGSKFRVTKVETTSSGGILAEVQEI